MSKKNGNGGPTSVLADLVEAVGDLRAEQATQADAVSALSNRMLELADLFALHAREFRESSRRMDERLAKFARTLITFTGTLDDHERRITALERG